MYLSVSDIHMPLGFEMEASAGKKDFLPAHSRRGKLSFTEVEKSKSLLQILPGSVAAGRSIHTFTSQLVRE